METKVRNGKSLSFIGSLLLFCVILLSCLIPGSAAQASSVDSVATVNGEGYATLSDAYAAAKGTAYPVVLQKDVTVSDFYIQAAVTLDLNGHTITAGTGAQMAFGILNGGSLTLSGTGTVEGVNQKFGIIYVAQDGSLTLLDNVTLTGNTANNGGAVYNYGGTFTMKGGTISGTKASENGGAVYNFGTFTMDGGVIKDSIAGLDSKAGYGGAVYNYGTFTMNGGDISDTTAYWYGGAVRHAGGTFTMNGGSISGSTARYGGAVYSTATFTMNGGDISDTTATYSGGAVYTKNAFTMKNGSITNAKATYGEWRQEYGGGGIYLAGGTANLEGGTISGCNAESSYGCGGGVFISADTTFTMSGGSISGCKEAGYGGGVYNAGTFTMSNGSIFGNGSSGVSGAGVYNTDASQMTMSDGMIAMNSGHGGVCFNSGTVNITGGAVFGNVWDNESAPKTKNVDFFGGKPDKDKIHVIAAGQMKTNGYSFDSANWRVHYPSSYIDVTDSLPSTDVTFDDKPGYLAYEAVGYTSTTAVQASGIFLNGADGNDTNAGTSTDAAVQTFERAKALAEAALTAGETNVTIYVCGQVTVSGTETWSLPANVTLKRLDGYDGYLVSVPSNATLTLKDITIDGNRPTLNGVNVNIKCTNSLLSVKGTLNLQDGAVLQNNLMGQQQRTYGGGAICCSGGTVKMTGGMMRNNETDQYGGAIAMDGGTFDMSGGTIQNNRADFGGAVALLRGAQMNLKETASIANNVANDAGGIAVGGRTTDTVVGYQSTTLTMTGGSISGNNAKAGSGGGIYVQVSCKATISKGYITGNHASGYNGRPWAGGGIYVNEQTTYSLTGSSTDLPDGVLQLYNVEIANNSASSGGGLAACPTSHVKIVLKDGGVFHDNESRTAADEIYVYESKSATAYISDFMLGGGMYQWMRSDGTRAEQSYYQNTTGRVTLNNICAPEDVKKAQSLAQVFITGNTADYNGGGIAANGTVLIGDTTDAENASITIEKRWESESAANTEVEEQSRPESVKVDIQYGSYILRGIVLSKQNNWTVTLQNVPNAILAQTNPAVKVMEFDSGWYTVKNVTATVKDNLLTISFTNIYAPHGDLTVQKTVSGVGADPLCAFDFTVMLSDRTVNGVYGDMTFTNGVAMFRLKHGQSATATGLPAGVTYTVSENSGSGYTASIRVNGQKVMEAKGNVPANAAAVVAFENISKFHIPKTGDSTPLTLCLLLMLLSLSGAGLLRRKKS